MIEVKEKYFMVETECGGIKQEIGQFDTIKEVNEYIKKYKEEEFTPDKFIIYECSRVLEFKGDNSSQLN